ncbi:hypothetical protein ACC719_11420 [Rhizobium ruizarguesonis]
MIDHVQHGWASLAMRIPEVRAYAGRARLLAEIAEAYSLTVLQLERLRRENATDAMIAEYEDQRTGIEKEVRYYLLHARKVADTLPR